jgi:tRNA A-37 threonylcarbamoyl transferase component Bud32
MVDVAIHRDDGKNVDRAVFVQVAGYHGRMAPTYHSEPFLRQLRSFLSQEKILQKPIKVSKTSEVFQWRYEETLLYMKRYLCAGMKLFFQTVFQLNKAQKSWRVGRYLLKRGIDTPQPIFYFRRRISTFKSDHILATAGIQNNMSLRDYINRNFQKNRFTQSEKRIFIARVAHFLGRLHLCGVYHGDLTSRNILVEQGNDVSHTRLFLIDLDAIRSTHWISRRRRIKNLDELGRNFLDLKIISTYDRARFLKNYLEIYHREKKSFKYLFREVGQRTTRRLVKHGQRFTT